MLHFSLNFHWIAFIHVNITLLDRCGPQTVIKTTKLLNLSIYICLSVYLSIHLLLQPWKLFLYPGWPTSKRPFLWYFGEDMILCERYNIEEWEEREKRVSVADLPCWIFPWEPQSIHSWAGQKRERKLRARREEVSGSALFLEMKMEFWCISQNPFILLGTTARAV